MEPSIKAQLVNLAEEDYRIFAGSLLPGVDNILGVRLPLLRKIAKQIVEENWRTFLETTQSSSFEEVMLQGMVIGYADGDIEEILSYVAEFIPRIDNWSLCDSFCVGLKFTKDNCERVWEFLQQYIVSDKEYEVRFGVVMLLNYYITSEYAPFAFALFDRIKGKGYYVMMAVAWAISAYYSKLPEQTMYYLRENKLDNITFNKALQKITESLKIDKVTKELIRSMKRKNIRLI